jgi:hypothetical protein
MPQRRRRGADVYAALKSWLKRRKTDPEAKPPHRRPRYYRIQWKAAVIRMMVDIRKNGDLILSNGRGTEPLRIPWRWPVLTLGELGGTGTGYESRGIYRRASAPLPSATETAGADLGEVHLAVLRDGQRTTIFSGPALGAKRQHQNQRKATWAAKQSRRKKGFRALWAQQRMQRLWGQTWPIAWSNPGAPSLVMLVGARRPRRTRSCRYSNQLSALSVLPKARWSNTRWPTRQRPPAATPFPRLWPVCRIGSNTASRSQDSSRTRRGPAPETPQNRSTASP